MTKAELEAENKMYKDFVDWLREVGFGEEQFREIMDTYLNDKGTMVS